MEILLGDGVFKLGGVAVGLCRGGGKFTVKPTYKNIQADGDYGPVKGRVRKTEEIVTLSMKRLQKILTNFTDMYPAVTTASQTGSFSGVSFAGTGTVISGTQSIATADYKATAEFWGKTLEGKDVCLQVLNAMCLEGIDWQMTDKDEVVPEVNYTGHYTEGDSTPPWKIFFINPITA